MASPYLQKRGRSHFQDMPNPYTTLAGNPVPRITLNIPADPTKTSNKEDLTTIKQVKTELSQGGYHYHTKPPP
jgi:hypothetical protein